MAEGDAGRRRERAGEAARWPRATRADDESARALRSGAMAGGEGSRDTNRRDVELELGYERHLASHAGYTHENKREVHAQADARATEQRAGEQFSCGRGGAG